MAQQRQDPFPVAPSLTIFSPEDQEALEKAASILNQPVDNFLRAFITTRASTDKGVTSFTHSSTWNNGYSGLKEHRNNMAVVDSLEPSNDESRDDYSDELFPQDPTAQDWDTSASDFLDGANRGRVGVPGSMNTWIDEFSNFPEPVLGSNPYQQSGIHTSIMGAGTDHERNNPTQDTYRPVTMIPFSTFHLTSSSEVFPTELYTIDERSRPLNAFHSLDFTASVDVRRPTNDAVENWESIDAMIPVAKPEMCHTNPIASNASEESIPAVSHENAIKPAVYSGSVEHGFELISYIPNKTPKPTSVSRPQRRGGFRDQRRREETAETRKLKACVRCRMQKIRVSSLSSYSTKQQLTTCSKCEADTNDPHGVCQTCKSVSKQKIYTLPCVRYRITECTLFRKGKGPGLDFTSRWPKMELKDITDWASTEVRLIKVKSDVCDVPLQLFVRKFNPHPRDSLHRSWMDDKTKKFWKTTPYAIVNMSTAQSTMRDYITKNVFRCVDYFLKTQSGDELVKQTYKFARRYMERVQVRENSFLKRRKTVR